MIVFLVFMALPVFSQDVRLGLFYDQITSSITFHCIRGHYQLFSQGQEIASIKKADIIFLEYTDGIIRVSGESGLIGSFTELELRDREENGRFFLRAVQPASNQRLSKGDLEVSIRHRGLHLVNTMDFDNYLAGVVEAEAGAGAPEEFFRVQAVLCRTYAIRNWNKHQSEGFNVCDDVHCQAFHGIADDNPGILNAVLSTHKVVITDQFYRLINAVYHSNSGGQTVKGGDLWPGNADYLEAIIDPFSEEQPNYRWEEKLDFRIWKSYLTALGIDSTELTPDNMMIRQPLRRSYVIIAEDTIPLRDIREDFSFRSSYFNTSLKGDTLIIQGKGYGHGIGLSQEGAMEMARQGYSYSDIIRYYYFNVEVRELGELPLSEVPEEFR